MDYDKSRTGIIAWRKSKKVVSKPMREKAEERFTELRNCPNGMFTLVMALKFDSKEV